jgi:hypothetical protein
MASGFLSLSKVRIAARETSCTSAYRRNLRVARVKRIAIVIFYCHHLNKRFSLLPSGWHCVGHHYNVLQTPKGNRMSNEAKCPFSGGAAKHTANKFQNNADWWSS